MSDTEVELRAQRRVGRVLNGKYTIDRVLGAGGMAAVYVATHRNQKQFAVKMLHPELSTREDIRARFLREGYAANSVKHPGAVAVIDDDVAEDGAAFLVMELLEGVPVEELWERSGRRLSPSHAVGIVHQVLDVLVAAHEHGIVHRDLKPANFFLTRDGQVKVLDFGIARVRDLAVGSESATASGVLLGTPAFMAPEQALGKSREIDARTDVWAMGATLFTLLSGQLVHEAETATELMVRAATVPPRSLLTVLPTAPAAIAQVTDRALQFDKNLRWPTAAAMRDALDETHRTLFGAPPSREMLAGALADVSDVGAAATVLARPVEVRATPEAGAHRRDADSGMRSAQSGRPEAAGAASNADPPSADVAGVPKTRILPFVVGGAALAVALSAGAFAAHTLSARRTLERAHADVVRCLIGEPLRAGENVTVRLHRIRLAAAGARKPDGTNEQPWPMRCSDRADALARAASGDAKLTPLAQAVANLGRVLSSYDTLSLSNDFSEPVETFFRESASAKLGQTESQAPQPPTPADAPSLDTLDNTRSMFGKSFSVQRVWISPFVDTALSLLVDDPGLGEPRLCSFEKERGVLRCRNVPAPAAQMSPGLRMWGTNSSNTAPYLFAGSRGKDGVFRSDTGARVVESVPFDGAYGASVLQPGVLDYLEWRGGSSQEMVLRHVMPDGKVVTTPALDKENVGWAFYSTALMWDWFVYRVLANDQIRLFVRHLEPDGKLGMVEDVGRIADVGHVVKGERDEPHLTGCRSADTLVVRSKAVNRQYVSMRVNQKWTAPVEADGSDGDVTCGSAEATITTVDPRAAYPHVIQSQCTISGCTSVDRWMKTLSVPNLVPPEGQFRAATIGGKLLIVWYAGHSSGLRMRLAPISSIEDAADNVLFDDHVKEGRFQRDSTYRGFRLLPTGGGALLLLETASGVFPSWIDETGAAKPVRVEQ